MELQPGQKVDRYIVEAVQGRGGMAVVYRVRHRTLDTLHALKVVTITSDQVRSRLILEGRVQARLKHNNVVAVTDVIDVDGLPGLIMEFVNGPPLDVWCAECRPSLAVAERVFLGILAAVEHAHDMGVVHRDLKPGNVLMDTERGLFPKVTDFGLARAVEEEGSFRHTRSGITMGTPAYMSPEHILDAKTADHQSDVFSLGSILYELVCGDPAFGGPNILAIYQSVAEARYRDPLEVHGALPARIVAAIRGCLVVDRAARIPDCRTLRRILTGKATWPVRPPARETAPQAPIRSGQTTDDLVLEDLVESVDEGLAVDDRAANGGSTDDAATARHAPTAPAVVGAVAGEAVPVPREPPPVQPPPFQRPPPVGTLAAGGGRLEVAIPSEPAERAVRLPPRADQTLSLEPEAPVAPQGMTARWLLPVGIGAVALLGILLAWALLGGGGDPGPDAAGVEDPATASASPGTTTGSRGSADPAAAAPGDAAPPPRLVDVADAIPATPPPPVDGEPEAEAARGAEKAPTRRTAEATTVRPTRSSAPPPARVPPVEAPSPPATSPAVPSTKPATETPPPAEAVPTGSVQVLGDVVSARLKDGSGRSMPAGTVPAGTYTLSVTLTNGARIIHTSEVVVSAGQSITIRCSAEYERCR